MPTNRLGQAPFVNHAPSRLDSEFFEHVEAVLRKSQALELFIGLGVGEPFRPDARYRTTNVAQAYDSGWALRHGLASR